MVVSSTPEISNRASVRTLMLLIVGVLAAAILAACSSSSDDETPTVNSAVEESSGESVQVADDGSDEGSTDSGESAGGVDPVKDDASGGFSIDPTAADDAQSESSTSEITPEPFPSLPIEEENNHLETALGMVPDSSIHFKFTHWNRLKRHNRVPEMTSENDMLARKRFMVQVLTKNQMSAVMDKDFFDVQAELWGWDSTDLVWEAEALFANLIDYLNILRVRPNFDMDAFAELLLERDFTPITYEGATIYSMPLEEDVDWYNISPLSIHNIVIFPDQDLIVMSPMIESVQQVLDTMGDRIPSFGDDPLVKRATFQLVGMAAVEMQRGLHSCEYYSAGNSDKGRLINAATEQLENWPVHPYQLMALGHAFSNEAQVDLVLFHYDDFRQAELDFEFRENLMRMGTSPKRNVPYSAQFILQDSELDDALMTFSLVPSPALSDRSGWPQTVIGWVQDQDALFAACVIEDFLGMDEMS